MFTGIVEEIGSVTKITRSTIEIQCKKVLSDLHLGDSVSTNGICLTVTAFNDRTFSADVMPETVGSTGFKDLFVGAYVNLERAMSANGRFGGHMVSGHIDGTGVVTQVDRDDNAVLLQITGEDNILKYIVEKGSIAIDGVSLTVVSVNRTSFNVSLIPMTGRETTLLERRVGQTVNLECDIYGKYVERFMTYKPRKKEISMAYLSDHGFL